MWSSRTAELAIVYPKLGTITGQQAISQACDYLATEYMRANPNAPKEAVDENARVSTVTEAIEILQDAGLVTFTQAAADSVRWHEDHDRRLDDAERAQVVQ